MSLSDIRATGGGAAATVTVDLTSGHVLVPVTPDIAAEFKRNPRTIKRWIANECLGFPKPVVINGRLYIVREALEAWKRARIAASMGAA